MPSDLEAPKVLATMGHPLRWAILSHLARSDQRVGELTQLLGEPQNLVSYHLRELRDAGLVSSRRSSFDGRDAYYRVNLARCGEIFCESAAALHPALQLEPKAVALPTGRGRSATGPVPLHRQQRPIPDGRGAARAPLRPCHPRPQRG